MALINVIIPVYNAKKYIEETVESVLQQPNNDNIEIILVDDGSNDGSAKLCDDLAKKNKNVFVIHQKNSGVSVARNRGINFCINRNHGYNEFLVFLDADDLWKDNVFSDVTIDEIQKNKSIDVYVFGSICCTEKRDRFSIPRIYEKELFDGGNAIIWKTQGTFCANLYRISLFEKWGIRFKEGLKYSEDKIFMMQCVFLANKVQFMPQLLHIYRQHTQSAMGGSTKIPPIDYYIPIIDGWINSDEFINSWEVVSGKHINAGKTLASIYFGDMSAEHYQRWKSRKKLEDVCKNHPSYTLYENMNPKAVSKKQYANQQMHKKYPYLYVIKNRMVGVFFFCVRIALKFGIVKRLRLQRKYPLQSIPNN